jgi:hypothetical protein
MAHEARGRLLGWLSGLLVRGPDAKHVRADLDEAFQRDLERGVAPHRARRRYLRNAVGSAVSLWRARLSPTRLSPSFLDVKLGVRMLRKNPGTTAVSVFALALGIPLGLTPQWLADTIEAPFPEPGGERIRAIRYWDTEASQLGTSTWYDYSLWRERLTSFESLGALRTSGYNVSLGGEMGAPVVGAEVTASTFEVLRSRPVLGRVLLAEDETIGGPRVAVIGHDLW